MASTANLALGAVAAGNALTADAAAEVLKRGGNAFDAALAALCAACVCEPVLCSLAGGGFLLARPARRPPLLFDFYGQTPRRAPRLDEVDFLPVEVDFGAARQQFHIGLGAVATPGVPAGLCAVHDELGRLPLTDIVAPAVRHARDGVAMDPLQAFILDAVAPIFLWSAEARALYESRIKPGETLQAGEILTMPRLADVLEGLAADGAVALLDGELAQALLLAQAEGSGTLSGADLNGYRAQRRSPLYVELDGVSVAINPPPSSGGALIAFALKLLQSAADRDRSAVSLARAMAATNLARRRAGLMLETTGERAASLLAEGNLAEYRRLLNGRTLKAGGTTHVSVVDRDGNAAALSVSNGEGCGHFWPGTEIMLNNMLGEEDTNPQGFFRWQPDSRISSMMAPTIVNGVNGAVTVLGSGGSNRIRSAILQVLVNLLHHGMDLADAVVAPRLHAECGTLNMEPGFAASVAGSLADDFEHIETWPDRNFFFGGVHAVSYDPESGRFEAAGDPRRGGVGIVVEQ